MHEKTDVKSYLRYIQRWTDAIDEQRYEDALSTLNEGLQYADEGENAPFYAHFRELKELTQSWLSQMSNEPGASKSRQLNNYKEGISCSFCGKTNGNVSTMVAGPSVYVCDQCIERYSQVITRIEVPEVRDKSDAKREETVRCSFCGKMTGEVGKLIAGIGAFICGECTVICAQIVDAMRAQKS